jgi:hypothetical protein
MHHNEPVKQLTLRLPEDLHARLKNLAETERRSLHAEILKLIEEALVRRGETSP